MATRRDSHEWFESDQAGLSRYLERDGLELPEHQFLRELVQNGFDADARNVVIDTYTDPDDGAEKLRISDDGDGMGATALRHHIKTLHTSGAGRAGNYGIGARIATLARNPWGVTWVSQTAGMQPHQVRASKGARGYGLQKFETEDGTWEAVYAPDDGILHSIVARAGHGTSVVLHGDHPGRVTGTGLGGAAGFLSRRYWQFPRGTKVSISLDGNLRPIYPTRELLNRDAVASGELTLEGSLPALLRWFVLPPAADRQSAAGRGVAGRLALLHRDELFGSYDEATLLTRFGIMTKAARNRVVLVLEPFKNVSMNTQRTRLVRRNDAQMPWTEWAEQFARSIPREVSQLIIATTPKHRLDELVARFLPDWQKLLVAQRRQRPIPKPDKTSDEVTSDQTGQVTEDEVAVAGRQGTDRAKSEGDSADSTGQERASSEPPAPRKRPRADQSGADPVLDVEEFVLPSTVWVDPEDWAHDAAWIAFSREANMITLRKDMPPLTSRVREVVVTRGIDEAIAWEAVERAYAVEAQTSVLTILNLARLQSTLRTAPNRSLRSCVRSTSPRPWPGCSRSTRWSTSTSRN